MNPTVPLTNDQILLADLLLTPLTLATENYLNQYYSSMGELISRTYGGDEPTRAKLAELFPTINSAYLVEFLLEQDYIAPGRNAGQFKITPVGIKVKQAGGHQKYQNQLAAVELEKQRQRLEATKPKPRTFGRKITDSWEYIGRHNLLSNIIWFVLGIFALAFWKEFVQLWHWLTVTFRRSK